MTAFRSRLPWTATLCLSLGAIVTVCLYGYRFGYGNHSVYLIDALRLAEPSLLRHDWFATQTLQYHVVFTQLSALLMRLGLIEPAFHILYLLMVILFHVALRGIVRSFGGSDGAYLLAVALYFLSAAGTGLGMYQFFQDSSLLPSNIANVAMLWGIYLWLVGRREWAGACFGIAGLFHLNHAVVGIGLWVGLIGWRAVSDRAKVPWLGAALAMMPSLANIALAANGKVARSGAMPLAEFVELYVRFRHPHHYDPTAWPIGIWIAFLWTLPAALLILRGDARRIVVLILLTLAVALIGAGMWYWSETLVQLSLYRFSIFVQLLGCVASAIWIYRRLDRSWIPFVFSISTLIILLTASVLRGPYLGLIQLDGSDHEFGELCQWISRNTAVDAVFLVPPDDDAMRLIGRRAIVVNFKAVPQLSAELIEWRRRLCDVLAIDDVDVLPRGYTHTLAAIRKRYDDLSAEQLMSCANKYGARYLIATRPLPDLHRVPTGATGRYLLYDLWPGG